MHKAILLFVTVSVSLFGQNQGAGGAPVAGQGASAQGAQGVGGRGAGAARGLQNLMILPEKTTFSEILPTMETFEVSLGVQCTFCHVQGNFARDDNPRKNVARAMMRIVDQFNKTFPDGKQRIGCWSCHRGSTKPEITPPANLLEEAAKAVAAGQGGRGGQPQQ